MQSLTPYIASDGTKYYIPPEKEAEFMADFGSDAKPARRFRTTDGKNYTIPADMTDSFRADFPDATPVRRFSFADGSSRDFTPQELDTFVSGEFGGERYAEDRRRIATSFGDATSAIVGKRARGENISRRDIAAAGFPEMSSASRNALGDIMSADYRAVNKPQTSGLMTLGGTPVEDAAAAAALEDLKAREEGAALAREEELENKEVPGYAKPLRYLGDLMTSFGSGLVGGLGKIVEGVGAASEIQGNAAGFDPEKTGAATVARAGRTIQEWAHDRFDTNLTGLEGDGIGTKALEIGKGVSSVSGEFAPAAIPYVGKAYGAALIGSGALLRGRQVYDEAIKSGMTEAQATSLAMGAGVIDAVSNMLLMGKFKGIWKGANKAATDAVKQNVVKKLFVDSLKTGGIMAGQGAANELIDEIAKGEEVSGGKIGVAAASKGLEGMVFHIANYGAHKFTHVVDWRTPANSVSGQYRKALQEPMIRALVYANSTPDQLNAVLSLRAAGKDVPQNLLVELGIPKEAIPTASDRNSFVDAMRKDFDTLRAERDKAEGKVPSVRLDEYQSKVLDDTIAEFGGEGEIAKDIRTRVIGKLKDARTMDDPDAREKAVMSAFEEYNAEHPQEGANSNEVRADEASAKPAERKAGPEVEAERPRPVEGVAKAGEEKGSVKPDGKGKMVPVEPKTAEIDKDSLSNYVKRGDGELGRFSVPGAEEGTRGWITGHSKDGADGQYHLNLKKVWNPKEGFDGTDFGRDMLEHAANNFCDQMEKAGVKVDRRQIVADFSSGNETYDIGELIKIVGRGKFEEAMRKLGYDGFVSLADDGIVTAFDPAAVVRAKAAAKPVETRPVAETGKETPEPAKPVETPSRASDAKPVPDGKGKMVKPKAESTTKTRSLEDIMADIDRANEEFEKAGRENDPSFEQKKEALAKLHSEYDKALAEKNKARQGFIDAIERQADKNVESNSKAGELGADGKPKPIDEATKSDLKTHYVFQAFEEGISDSGKLSSKEGVGEVFDMFKKLVEKYNPARDENGTISMQSVRRAAWMIESSDFATKEQKAFAHKYGEKFRTSTDKPMPDGKGKMVKPKTEKPAAPAEPPKPDGKGKMVKPSAQKKPIKANPKKAAKVTEEFVSKDKTRASLQSVFHDHENGVAVASDGRVLIATKHGYDPNAKMNPEITFPNWKQIVPDYSKGSYEHIESVVENGKPSLQKTWLDVQEAEVDPAAISSACKKAAALANKIKHSGTVYVRLELPDGKGLVFDGANLRRVADAMAANGITKIKAVGQKAPLLAENSDTTILAMPVKIGDADFKPGRGGEHFVIDARTGRVLSAPDRSDNVAMFSRGWADDLRRQIAKGKAETVDYVRKSGLFKNVLNAVKRGETDAKTVYEGLPGENNWEKLSQSNKDAFAEWLKIKDENALAERMAEHLADSNLHMPTYSWRKKLPSELEKIEKRIAAEDEIDSLMSGSPVAPKPAEAPVKRVPDGKGKMVKPEVAKPSEPTPLQNFLSDRPKGLAKKAEQNLNRQINRGNGKYSSDLEEVERAVGTKAYIDTFGDGKGKTYYQINHADGTSETISKTAADYAISRGIESRIEKPTETRELTDREKYDAAKEKYRKAQEAAKKSDGKAPIDKELGSILDGPDPMGVKVRDAAREVIDRLTEKYGEPAAAELEAHFDKFFGNVEKDGMSRSRAEGVIGSFINSLPKKYELDGWTEEIAPRKFTKTGIKDVDNIQESLLDKADEYYGTDFEDTFRPLKYRDVSEAKLSKADKAALGKLSREFEDAIDDLERSLDLVSTETRTGERKIRGEVDQGAVEAYESARENIERFLEQAERYQNLKRDKNGRPLFSRNPDAEPDLFSTPKNEKAKLQRIEPVASEPPKSPEQEIAERLDLKRLDPKRRSDPKVIAWAKKNGRNVTNGMVTPDAVRAYDEAMTHATAKLALRWFPDMKPMEHKYGEDIKRGVHVIDLRDTSGGVLGWFDPKAKEVHLLPGADPKTVAHEIMWHGTRDYITQLAANGDARAQKFLDMMHDVEQNAPKAIKDLVNRIYARGGKAVSRDTLLNEYGAWFTMKKGGEALEQALQTDAGRNWFARGLHAVKEMFKDFLARHGRNRVDLSAIDGMTRDEFVDFLAKEFSSGKTLGNIKGKQPPTLSTKETAWQRYKRRFYDQDAAVRDTERDIEKKTGKKISADDSVEAANALKYGLKEAANIETQGEKREFIKTLSKTGIHYEDFEYYAALKAAAGRDAKIDARNIAELTAKLHSEGASAQDIADAIARYKTVNGSHIDPREARMMLDEIENGPDAAKFKKAYDAIRQIIDATLDTQVKAGLVGSAEAAQWRKEEPYYIPFKNEYDAETGEWAGRGMSRNYAKPEHYTAKGRQSAAGDILAHIFMDHQAAKLRAIENGVRQKLANLVRANPELGKVEVLGKNETGIEANNPNVVVFKEGGRSYKITLEGTRGEAIANAFTQRNQLKMGWADRKFMGISMRGFARATAGMATRYSPTFAVRNTTKDNIELANIVYSERGPIEGTKWMMQYAKVRAATLKNVANVLTGHKLGINGDTVGAALAKYITTGKIDASSEGGKILDRYIKAGGLIAGGTRAEAFDSIKKSLTPETIAKEMRRGNSKPRAVVKHVLGSIGYLNEYAEMATRVGIFATEIKAGKSDAEAALFARRATVDFNRHGDWTPAFNMFRLFSNSTLGATARAAAALTKSKYGAAAVGALFVNGLARAFIDHFINADEDERRRKAGKATGRDISEYERRTSLFYFRNGDKLYKVAEHESPFSLISYAGDCIGRWICGDLDGEQVAKNLGVTTAEVAYNFLPMGSINLTAQNGGFSEDAKAALISGVVPTAAQPIAELWANIDYAGRTIYNEPYPGDMTPRAEQGRDSTPDWAKEVAVGLNEATRSEGSRKGYVDIPPEAIQKLVEGYGKNALRDVSMAVGIGEAVIKGDFSKYDPRNTPVKRDFVRPLDGNDKRFVAAAKKFRENMDYFKKMSADMTPSEKSAYVEKFPHVRDERGDKLLKEIARIRKMERGFGVRNGKFVPHEWPQEKLDEFKENRRRLQAQFLELMGDK